jgi:hypothetical protein
MSCWVKSPVIWTLLPVALCTGDRMDSDELQLRW